MKVQVRVTVPSQHNAAGCGHDSAHYHIDDAIHSGRKEVGRKGEIGQFREEHALHGEGCGEIEARLHSLSAACASDGIAERNGPRVLIRQDTV